MSNVEAGYYYPPEPPETDWDRYYNGFEIWLNDNYDKTTGLVYDLPWSAACESDDLLEIYIRELKESLHG